MGVIRLGNADWCGEKPIERAWNFSDLAKAVHVTDRKLGGGLHETPAMFMLPACDPFAITVMGFGILLAAILTFAF
jgi:hypothetical protein